MVVYGTTGLTRRGQANTLLAQAAETHWGLTPLPPIRRAEGGKPCFAHLEGHEFNLSHSGAYALCALDQTPVGVDIQLVKSWRPTLPRRVCSQAELAWLGGGDDFWLRFTLLWALKESRVKCLGIGLRGNIAAIPVPLPERVGTALRVDGLWFRAYEGQGWRAAACGLTPPPEEILWLEGAP